MDEKQRIEIVTAALHVLKIEIHPDLLKKVINVIDLVNNLEEEVTVQDILKLK